MDESALWEKIPQGKLTVPLWYTTRVFPLWETQRADRVDAFSTCLVNDDKEHTCKRLASALFRQAIITHSQRNAASDAGGAAFGAVCYRIC